MTPVAPQLHYVTGDVTAPAPLDPAAGVIVVQCVNDAGLMGAGVAKAIAHRWPVVRDRYLGWASARETGPGDAGAPFALGNAQLVRVGQRRWVANVIGQHGVRRQGSSAAAPIRYDALESGLRKVAARARALGAELHAPRLGAGLAGGDWDRIATMLNAIAQDVGVPIVIYDLAAAGTPDRGDSAR